MKFSNLFRMALLSLTFLSLTLSLTAFARTAEEIRAEIQAEMNQRHPNPAKNFWTNLGQDALPVIKQMYQNTTDVYEKSWLIDGMGYFKDSDTAAIMKNDIRTTDDEILKRKLLNSLIQSQGEAEYDFVEPYLKDSDPHVRLTVAQSLSRLNSARAQKRMSEFYTQEKLAWVRTSIKAQSAANTLKIKREGQRDHNDEETRATPLPQALTEKEWVGEWKGVLMTLAKNSSSTLILTATSALDSKWKIVLKLPKSKTQEFAEKDSEIIYYQTASSHWIEVRNKKLDSIFIGQRPFKK